MEKRIPKALKFFTVITLGVMSSACSTHSLYSTSHYADRGVDPQEVCFDQLESIRSHSAHLYQIDEHTDYSNQILSTHQITEQMHCQMQPRFQMPSEAIKPSP